MGLVVRSVWCLGKIEIARGVVHSSIVGVWSVDSERWAGNEVRLLKSEDLVGPPFRFYKQGVARVSFLFYPPLKKWENKFNLQAIETREVSEYVS